MGNRRQWTVFNFIWFSLRLTICGLWDGLIDRSCILSDCPSRVSGVRRFVVVKERPIFRFLNLFDNRFNQPWKCVFQITIFLKTKSESINSYHQMIFHKQCKCSVSKVSLVNIPVSLTVICNDLIVTVKF